MKTMDAFETVKNLDTLDIPDDVLFLGEDLFSTEDSWKLFLVDQVRKDGELNWNSILKELKKKEASEGEEEF
jgi:hypothetical protein